MNIHIGKRIKEERKRLGLTQSSFAEHGGVILRSQVNYEQGKRLPDAGYLAKIAEIGADILYIITDKRTPVKIAALSVEETSLIDYYRQAAEEGRKALEATGAAVAKPKKVAK